MKAAALERSIIANTRRLRRFAVSLAGPDDADDLFQTTCETAFRKRRRLRSPEKAPAWLMTIMYRRFLSDRRAAARRRETAAETLPEIGRGASSALKLSAVRVVDALETLPDDQRAALVLVAVEGWSSDEAGALLDLKPGSVRARVSRARERLRELLGEDGLESLGGDQSQDRKAN
ncbi:MAG: RNA polymerase sigma factor [Oceanicaulis sp.]